MIKAWLDEGWEDLRYKRYESETAEDSQNGNKEADLVTARIAHILDSPGYPLKIASLKAIHRKLFKDIYNHAGLTEGKMIKRIASFASSIWKSHTFMDGNTRTTAVFMEC
ncbi:Fic family protein [Lacrimispora brassicae]